MRKPRSPYLKLARLIEDEGFEHREFAKLVGMGESTLSTRLNPKPEQKNNEWRHYEITAICRELHIPQEQNMSLIHISRKRRAHWSNKG